MDTKKKKLTKYWCYLDHVHGIDGRLPEGDEPNLQLYNSQIGTSQGRTGEGLILAFPETDPLLQIRTHLSRGQVREAKELIEKQQKLAKESLERVELLMESARSQIYSGNWSEALRLTEFCLSKLPPPVSRLALQEMLALCFFELGEFVKSRQALDKAIALGEIYPHSTSNIYSQVLLAKLEARTIGLPSAKRLAEKLWKELVQQKPLNPDFLSVLLRLEIDLRKIEGLDYSLFALSSYHYENFLGDEVYRGLALVDLYYGSLESDMFEAHMKICTQNHLRIRNLVNEIEGLAGKVTTTAADTIQFRSKKKQRFFVNESRFCGEIHFLLHLEHKVFANLKNGKIVDLSSKLKVFAGLKALLENTQLSKQLFFNEVWGPQKYVPHLHDGLIRSLIHRLRSEIEVDVYIVDQRIILRGGIALW